MCLDSSYIKNEYIYILKKISRENKHQILRFIISGLIATGINFLIYNLFYLIFKNILFASISGYSTGLVTSFALSKIWVFRDNTKKRIFKSFFTFVLIYFLGGLEMSLTIIFLNKLVGNYRVVWLFGAIVGALNNYLGSKYFLFEK